MLFNVPEIPWTGRYSGKRSSTRIRVSSAEDWAAARAMAGKARTRIEKQAAAHAVRPGFVLYFIVFIRVMRGEERVSRERVLPSGG